MQNVVRCFAGCQECSLNRKQFTQVRKTGREPRLKDGTPIALVTDSRNNRQDLHTKFIHNGKNKEDAIMKEGIKIKVIKRGEIKAPVKTLPKSKRASAREVVSNVTNWVNDLQARKRDETKIAIEKFFNNNPQPSEL